MDISKTSTLVKEVLQLQITDHIPTSLTLFLEASKTTPTGFYRPYIALVRYWQLNPPRGGIIAGEGFKWKDDSLGDQIDALEALQKAEDALLPPGESIPEGWGLGLVDLPLFAALII